MIFTVQVHPIPTTDEVSLCLLTEGYIYVGNLKLDMMPAGHGLVGNDVVSGARVLGV